MSDLALKRTLLSDMHGLQEDQQLQLAVQDLRSKHTELTHDDGGITATEWATIASGIKGRSPKQCEDRSAPRFPVLHVAYIHILLSCVQVAKPLGPAACRCGLDRRRRRAHRTPAR